MAFATKRNISSRWQLIFKDLETKLLLNLKCDDNFFFLSQSPINSTHILIIRITSRDQSRGLSKQGFPFLTKASLRGFGDGAINPVMVNCAAVDPKR